MLSEHPIQSMIDTDQYKLTMQQGVLRLYPNAVAEYWFIDRRPFKVTERDVEELKELVKAMADIRLTDIEYNFLRTSIPFLSPAYVDFLRGFRYDPAEVEISRTKDERLQIRIRGYWYRTIMWEVPLMALISEWGCAKQENADKAFDSAMDRVKAKQQILNNTPLWFADFATRRRFSFAVQAGVVAHTMHTPGFLGVSNVHLARLNGVKAIGTHAHEWFMYHSAAFGPRSANRTALKAWTDVYNGNLGVALSDTFTTDVFFRDFDAFYARLFDGLRHDSGDPYVFADKAIAHYQSLGIDPMSKTIVFSDGLTISEAYKIQVYCEGKIKSSAGIGTHMSNDTGVTVPLNIVIKPFRFRPEGSKDWIDVCKLSDVAGKHSGSLEAIDITKRILGKLHFQRDMEEIRGDGKREALTAKAGDL